MQITPKARLISLIIALVFMSAALIGSGIYLIANHLNQVNATTDSEITSNAITTTNLFNTDGTINATAAKTLLKVVGYYDYAATTTGYKAHQIRSRTNSTGTDAASNPDDAIIFPMGYYNGTDENTPLYWQATYLYNNYLTIWLVKGYTNSVWNSNSVVVNYNTYENSDIQTYLDDTLYSVITQDSNSLQSIFALPSTVGYQSTDTTNQTYWFTVNSSSRSTYNNLALAVAENSYLWLPSAGETMNNQQASWTNDTENYTGQWGLNQTDRQFGDGNNSSQLNYDGITSTIPCWLRSGRSNYSVYAMLVHSTGTPLSLYVEDSYGVRPACHISLSALANYTQQYTITTNVSPAGAGSVTGGGAYNYNTRATLTATANSGYEFVGWDTNGNNQYDSGEPTANPYTFTVTGNVTVTAIFRQLINITIRTNNTEYGQIFVNGSLTTSTTLTQDANTQISNIMAIAQNNCAFLYWYDESTGSVYLDNPLNYTVSRTATLTAYFGNGVVDGVAVIAENGGEARVSGYDETDAMTIHVSAVAYTGYEFLGWYILGENTPISTELSADLTLSQVQNKIIIARFALISNADNIDDTTDNGYTDDFE